MKSSQHQPEKSVGLCRFGKKLGYDDDVCFFFLPAKEGTFKFESI